MVFTVSLEPAPPPHSSKERMVRLTPALPDEEQDMKGSQIRWAGSLGLVFTLAVAASQSGVVAAADTPSADPTFSKDIAPVLQRSCQNCHRPDGVAPMSLVSYADVRPWARAIKQRTSIGPKAGVMPPWYIEKNVGIQKYKNDPSLSAAEVAMIGRWADAGAPEGN